VSTAQLIFPFLVLAQGAGRVNGCAVWCFVAWLTFALALTAIEHYLASIAATLLALVVDGTLGHLACFAFEFSFALTCALATNPFDTATFWSSAYSVEVVLGTTDGRGCRCGRQGVAFSFLGRLQTAAVWTFVQSATRTFALAGRSHDSLPVAAAEF
jgi:hypothetical protein